MFIKTVESCSEKHSTKVAENEENVCVGDVKAMSFRPNYLLPHLKLSYRFTICSADISLH